MSGSEPTAFSVHLALRDLFFLRRLHENLQLPRWCALAEPLVTDLVRDGWLFSPMQDLRSLIYLSGLYTGSDPIPEPERVAWTFRLHDPSFRQQWASLHAAASLLRILVIARAPPAVLVGGSLHMYRARRCNGRW